MLPVTAMLQLTDAYVPVICVAALFRVPVTANGHDVGTLGDSRTDTFDPSTPPESVPPLLFAALAKVDAHVPPSDEPVCEMVVRIIPAPTRLSFVVPAHVPLTFTFDGVAGLFPLQAVTRTSIAATLHQHTRRIEGLTILKVLDR
jgi:hypothetical protein